MDSQSVDPHFSPYTYTSGCTDPKSVAREKVDFDPDPQIVGIRFLLYVANFFVSYSTFTFKGPLYSFFDGTCECMPRSKSQLSEKCWPAQSVVV